MHTIRCEYTGTCTLSVIPNIPIAQVVEFLNEGLAHIDPLTMTICLRGHKDAQIQIAVIQHEEDDTSPMKFTLV